MYHQSPKVVFCHGNFIINVVIVDALKHDDTAETLELQFMSAMGMPDPLESNVRARRCRYIVGDDSPEDLGKKWEG
ncbi:hypothetical protein ACFX13_015100 [Malus domestica]